MKNPYGDHVNWLSDEEYQKAVGQLRLQLNEVFKPFNTYGLDVFITGAITETVRLSEDFGLRVRGVDKPLSIDKIKKEELYGKPNKKA